MSVRLFRDFRRAPMISLGRLTTQGYEIVMSAPQQLREHVAAGTRKWAEVVKYSGATVD
jgi:hypothetical protein